MSSQQSPLISNQTLPFITPLEIQSITQHGESPTAIILAIAILISVLLGSITQLVHVIGITKSSR